MEPSEAGFLELTTYPEGATLYLVAGSFYAIEKSPNEKFTIVRTSVEPLMVVETPEVIFERWAAMQKAAEDRLREEVPTGMYGYPEGDDDR